MRKKFNITKYRKRLITTYITSDGSSEISVKRTSGKERRRYFGRNRRNFYSRRIFRRRYR